jgi:branched-chain amino acid transport system permease protein
MKYMFYLTLGVALLGAPYYCNTHVITILILAYYAAYIGQCWNILLGFAGQLSFGHALYTGLGSYLAAGLFVHYGWSPLLTLFPIMIFSGLVGASIGFLGFRFGVQGVYFTLLTIAFAECGRILFEHLTWFGATAGIFIPINAVDFWHLRLGTNVFYYLFLGLMLIGFGISYFFLKTRFGYFSLATRENEQAAQALGISTFAVKTTVMGLSAGLTSIGGVFYAFYQNSLFPEQAFSLSNSIELTMGTIVGGVGTLLGPILGSLILIPLGEIISYLSGEEVTGLKHLFYGATLLTIILFFPNGIIPALSRRKEKTKDRP